MLSEAALALEVRINDDSGSVMDSVKLIASDMDGTLLNGKGELDPAFFPLFRELELRGIRFAAASGRQYPALARLFDPVHEELLYIADNGAHVRVENKDLYVSKMDLETSHELVRDVRALGNGCECAYCVAGIAYFSPLDLPV